MKLISVSFLLLCVGALSCYNSKPVVVDSVNVGGQLLYAYSSDGTGYSDIQMLYTTDSTIKAQPFFQRSSLQTTGVNIHCKIRKTIIASAGDSMQVCFEIVQPDVNIISGDLPVDAGMIMKEMVMPVFADMSLAGNILRIKTDTAVSYATAGIVKNILSNTQAILLPGGKENWEVTEENAVGLFKANYEVVHKYADSIEYQKLNSGYEKTTSVKKGQKFFPDSRTTIITDAQHIVQRISISESLITMFGADTIVASGSSTEYKLLSATIISHEALLAFEQLDQPGKYAISASLSAPLSTEEINRLAYKNTLADDDFKTLSAKLELVKTSDAEYESELVKKFRALAWLSETDCSKMAALLKAATPASDTFRLMSHALAAVETPFSINKLAVIIAERSNEASVMTELLPVLAISPTPTINAAGIIRELAFSKTTNAFTAATAQLTLGGMIKNLGRVDQKKADELTDVIVENMKDSRDTLQQLLVYGNTGAYRFLPFLSSYIFNPSVSVEMRKTAVFATRLIDHKEAGLLLDKLSFDKDTVISKTAKETIKFRSQYLYRDL